MLLRALFCLAAFLLNIPAAFAADKSIDLRIKEPSASTAAPRRLALVVGNSAYRFSGALANPASDAELMAKTLKEVGFQLHGGGAQVNLTRAALDQAIESFGDDLRPGDVALFYYSGHGLQVNGENYLVPVDADIKKEAEVRVKTVPVNLLFAKLEGVKDAVNIVILDACRNNPFARSFRSSGGGLAAVNAPTGTIVAFSTGPGQVAEDGAGKNSTYTAALAQYVREPGLRVEDVFKKVRISVSGSTRGSQTPWENTSLVGDFSFSEGDDLIQQGKKEEIVSSNTRTGSVTQTEREAKTADGTNWVLYYDGDSGFGGNFKLYIDEASIQRLTNGNVIAWCKTVNNSGEGSRKIYEIDCNERKYTVRAIEPLDIMDANSAKAYQSLLMEWSYPEQSWEYIDNGHGENSKYTIMCKGL